MFRQQTDFDYIAILQLTGNDLIVDESRTMVRAPQHENKLPLLITNGFSTFELIFHPFYQGAYEFSAPETVQVEGRLLFQIRFRHVHGARSPSVLKLRQREYPVEWQGTAWIEPASGAVVRVSAELDGEHGRHRPEIPDRRCPLRALRVSKGSKALTGCPRRRPSKSRRRTSDGAILHTFSQVQALLGGRENRSGAIEMSAATSSRYTPRPRRWRASAGTVCGSCSAAPRASRPPSRFA